MAKKRSASSRSGARETKSATSTTAISAEEFDRKFDDGEDVSAHLDMSTARRPGRHVQRVNVDFPVDLLRRIDHAADLIGVTRQAFIKMRVADALKGTW